MDFYKNNPTNLHHVPRNRKLSKKQRIDEIRENLEVTIKLESKKVGGGNKELIAKFQLRLDKLGVKK